MTDRITVAEFIEILKTKDQGAIVQVLYHDDNNQGYYCQGGVCHEIDYDGDDCMDYTDFRGNNLMKPDNDSYNKRYLLIGKTT